MQCAPDHYRTVWMQGLQTSEALTESTTVGTEGERGDHGQVGKPWNRHEGWPQGLSTKYGIAIPYQEVEPEVLLRDHCKVESGVGPVLQDSELE